MNPILSLPGRIPSLSKPQVDRFSLVFHCGRFLSTRVQEGGLLQSRAPAGAATRAAGAGGALGTLRPGPLQRPSKGVTETASSTKARKKALHQTDVRVRAGVPQATG